MKVFIMLLLSGICFLPMATFSDCIKGDCANGKGTMIYPDGSEYVGQWKNDKRNGQGTMRFPDGGSLAGQWKEGRFSGTGTMNYSYGQYVGQWKDGMKNGQGSLTYFNGSSYVGQWEADKRNGQGTMVYRDNKKYVGQWKDDKRNGHGTMVYHDGGKYEGQWGDDTKNGHGTMTYPDSSRYEGQWKDSRKNGQGIMIFSDGTKYEGRWKNGKFLKDMMTFKDHETGRGNIAEGSPKGPEVKVEIKTPRQMSEGKVTPIDSGAFPYTVQVGSYQNKEKSNSLALELREKGLHAFVSPTQITDKGNYHRVFVGWYRTLEASREASSKLKGQKDLYPFEAKMPYSIQVGTFNSEQEITKLETDLRSKAYLAYRIPDSLDKNNVRLLLGAFRTEMEAARLAKKLQAEGFKAKVTRR